MGQEEHVKVRLVETVIDYNQLIERLAEFSHQQWAGWAQWMFNNWDKTHSSGETFQDRWHRQIETHYADLSETEKNSDRKQAQKMLDLYISIMDEIRTNTSGTGGACGK